MKIVQPWPIFIAGLLMFFVVAWFSLATVDFAGHATLSGFRTGGWFTLGFPFVLGCAFVYALFFAFIARRGKQIVAVGALFIVSSFLTYSGVVSALPSSRLPEIVGSNFVHRITVKRFRTFDSMNEGITVYGILSIPRDVMRAIVEDRQLIESQFRPLSFLSPIVEGTAIPEMGQVLQNDRTRVYYDEPTEMMYFCDHLQRRS